MIFCDRADIMVRSGNGGRGIVSFRREKNVPFGGPDGGHGGQGGSIFFKVDKNLMTLIDCRYQSQYVARNGHHGEGRSKTGAGGEDVFIHVPAGTEIFENDVLLWDLVQPGQEVLVCKGGRGGAGNIAYKTSTNRAPRQSKPGEPGQEKRLSMRLKLLARVGLIGFPNAGKSTLLRALTNATPETAPYPFTTRTPQLGMFMRPDLEEILMADLPGLIEGAHLGRGLGHQFLGHGERCDTLFHLIDATSENPIADYQAVRHELEAYNPLFKDKKETIILTKKDLLTEQEQKDCLDLFQGKAILISALMNQDLDPIQDILCHLSPHPFLSLGGQQPPASPLLP